MHEDVHAFCIPCAWRETALWQHGGIGAVGIFNFVLKGLELRLQKAASHFFRLVLRTVGPLSVRRRAVRLLAVFKAEWLIESIARLAVLLDPSLAQERVGVAERLAGRAVDVLGLIATSTQKRVAGLRVGAKFAFAVLRVGQRSVAALLDLVGRH